MIYTASLEAGLMPRDRILEEMDVRILTKLSEYLPSLQERQKWIKPHRDFTVGNLVLIADERVHHGHWPLGRVLEVHPGRDVFV